MALSSVRSEDMTFTAMSRICQKENKTTVLKGGKAKFISAIFVVTVWKVGDDSEGSDYSNFSLQHKKTGDSITTGR